MRGIIQAVRMLKRAMSLPEMVVRLLVETVRAFIEALR
jgi:hypothetical protein